MAEKRIFSIFISSTYEDLREERQALIGVSLESGFIPVGMEQFHGAPANQWDVITKFIDECDFYLLVIGGRYGSLDDTLGVSYTEKEYNYAKDKKIPVLVLIKENSSITEDKKDTGNNKFELMQKLEDFRTKVKNDNNTVDFFSDINSLKYAASQTLNNAKDYAGKSSGWVRYKDVEEFFDDFENKFTEEENNFVRHGEMSLVKKESIDKLFHVENHTLVIGSDENNGIPIVGKEDVGFIPTDSAFLLVYAAEGNGKILKVRDLSGLTFIITSGKSFMSEESPRESAKWVEALDRLIKWGWVKPLGNKGEIYELTGTGYNKADWLKEEMGIDTNRDPREEIKEYE